MTSQNPNISLAMA